MNWTKISPKILYRYENGNHRVTLFSDGTKLKETINPNDNHFTYNCPESFDLKITDYCDAGCAYCFVPGTTVKTVLGNEKIENLKIGDYVWSYNCETNQKELKQIKKLYKHDVNEKIYKFTLDNGKVFCCTGNHKIYTNNGVKLAKDITAEDELLNF
jgi:hypothetical protein